jgi:hypothetical protein
MDELDFKIKNVTFEAKVVATLTLGSWPKQGLANVHAKNKGGHISCSWKCRRVWRNEPHTPKWTPKWTLTLGIKIPMDSWLFKRWL